MLYEKILLVRLGNGNRSRHPQGVRLPFTLKYLQAILLRRGYKVKLMDCHITPYSPEELVSQVIDWDPDAVVISSTPLERHQLNTVARRIKERSGVITIAVGQDVSLDPAYYLNGAPVDLAIPGEAEQVCAETIDALRDKKNLKERQTHFLGTLERGESILVEQLDDLPLPVYEAGELAHYPHRYPMPIMRRAVWGHLMTSRGCPYPCMFCNQMTRESSGARPRLRDPARVVEEMEYLKNLGATVLAFDDDNLTTDPRFVKALCQEIICEGSGLPWIAHSRVDNLTLEMADSMKRAGCALLRFGIESAVPRIVQLLKKGGTDASEWCRTTRKAVEAAHRNGIPTLGLFIIGSPTETETEILETIRFALELPLDFVQVHFFTPYVGSGAYQIFREKIESSVITEQYHYNAPKINLSDVETRRLVELRAIFYRQFYLRPGWIARHIRRYGGFYVANPHVLGNLLTPLWR